MPLSEGASGQGLAYLIESGLSAAD
jgi:hypothetical protein